MEEHVEALTPEEDRARRELVEFRSRYPEVSLSREELLRLAPEMVGENPKTLTEAYRSWQEAEIAELRAQLAAQAQNQENRAASPSSQSDSGAPQAAGPYDQFLSAYTG